MTNCWKKDCAELSICKRPTGRSASLQETVISIYERYGSKTPLPMFMKLKRTISEFTHCLLLVIGSKFHSLKIVGKPLGRTYS